MTRWLEEKQEVERLTYERQTTMTKQQEFDQIMQEYIPELHRTAGSVRAQTYEIHYLRGWVHIDHLDLKYTSKYRVSAFRKMLANLKAKPDFKP